MSPDTSLPPSLVEQKARSIFGQRRHRFAALLQGSGQPGKVSLDEFDVEIVPTHCELDLRRQMAVREGSGGAALYLVDWHDDEMLPRDVRARVAEGKLYRIGREERLRQTFHATRLSYDLILSPLARLAAAGELEAFPKSPKLSLDLEFAALTWLEQTIGEPFRSSTPKEADLLQACRDTSHTVLLGKSEQDSDWRAWLESVPRIIHENVSPLAGVAWRAWLNGQLDLLPAVLWLLEAFEQSDAGDKDRKLLRAVLRRHVPHWADCAMDLSLTGDGSTVDAWDALLRQNEPKKPPASPHGIETLIEELDSLDLLEASCRLPEGRLARERNVSGAIQRLLERRGASSSDDWDEFKNSVVALAAHRSITDEFRVSLTMLRRLAAWLIQPAHVPEGSVGSAKRAVSIATRFAEEGGYVDWARRVCGRERPDGPLGEAWAALRDAVEKRRDADEQEFARGMQSWAASSRPSIGCVPIERASKTFVADFLRGAPPDAPRRLLVILMDGMSWARCQELCESLRPQGWEPLRWTPTGHSSASMQPMLAAFPTITSVSRSAFFAGELPTQGPEPKSSKDPQRWANNPALKGLEGPAGLPLFMKADIEAERHLPSRAALDCIADLEQPLVAAIVNTLDDALKGAPSLEFTTQAIDIKPLRELLLRADQANRAVLLVADHGHVLSERAESLKNAQEAGGARWRVHHDTQALHASEALLDRGAWSPEPGQGVILLTGERAQYSRHSHHGEHGGLSLAEVVSPAILLGTSRLYAATNDAALDLAPPQTPAWWSDMRPAIHADAPTQPAARRPRLQPQSLFGDLGSVDTAVEPPRPGRSSIAPAWVKQLQESSAFKAAVKLAPIPEKDIDRTIVQALAATRVLVASGGTATSRSLALATDVALTRVGGLMARVTSILNAEGETCVRKDDATDSYLLDLERMKLVFGVALKHR